VEVVASLSQGRTASAQCGLFTHKSVPVIFELPCIIVFLILSFLEILAERRQKSISVEFNFATVFAFKHNVSAAYVTVLLTIA